MRKWFVRCVAVVVFAAAVQGWRFYKELYPYPIMFTTKIESEEDYDLLDGPASVMISDDMFRGPKGILNKMALFFCNRMISARAMIVRSKLKISTKRGR
ncbi:MAG: hypothetical protein E7L17_08715 [Clostridium sp.]|uniref:hypothetical protein n=1 Tax=Clostridium sp. TaxID=1506 RepID=UPI00290C1626|nr:hypothetical protein [Clostridium sp.]MDU7338182.1 hypothetical protein [Clostridium sp.]